MKYRADRDWPHDKELDGQILTYQGEDKMRSEFQHLVSRDKDYRCAWANRNELRKLPDRKEGK